MDQINHHPANDASGANGTNGANRPPVNENSHSTTQEHRGNQQNERSPTNQKDGWFWYFLGLLGFPVPWWEESRLEYTDAHKYPVNPTSKTPKMLAREDITLSADSKSHVPLRVQATRALIGVSNCTWERHYINDISTYTVQISKVPLAGRVWMQEKYGQRGWGVVASWAWYGLLWILAFSMLVIWFVSNQTSIQYRIKCLMLAI